MRRIRQFAAPLLIALFWVAQVHGTVHAASHLGTPSGVSDGATIPHSVVCLDCAAVSQAGAAPILSLPTTFLESPTDAVVETAAADIGAAAPAAAYRSRAPPRSPI